MPPELKTLYRPVGKVELELIGAAEFRKFLLLLPEQPFSDPVLNEEYAVHIARDWNTKDERSGLAGFVLRFRVHAGFLNNYEIHTGDGSTHREYWIRRISSDSTRILLAASK